MRFHPQTAMFGSEKAAAASLTASPPAPAQQPSSPPQPWLPRPPLIHSAVWRTLDVRAMVLLSLLFQIALFFLGKRRKHSASPVNKMILWLAYQSKDWVSIAALGKLSNSKLAKLYSKEANNCQDNYFFRERISNFLTSLWTPLLILHLGGPDTITALSFQDTHLWNRHLLILVVQCFLAFCIIIWSMDLSFLLVFTIPLYFVGISKYIERILCLKVNKSMKTKQIIPILKSPDLLSHPLMEKQESKMVLLGYALFTAMRPDVNDYRCHMEYPLSFKVRMRKYLKETKSQVKLILQGLLGSEEQRSSSHLDHFDVAVVELGFIFDVVYTKAAFIYTRKGCILRLISFTLSIGTLFFFQLSFGRWIMSYGVLIDVFLTMSLLVGAVALDICAVLSILCSDWAIILMHDNRLGRKILQYVLQYFPCFLSQQKRRSARMGQFDLLEYCWNSKKVGVYRFLQKYCSGEILENCHRLKHTEFVEVPRCLKQKEVYQSRLDSFFVSSDSFKATRGEKTLLQPWEELSDIRADLECSIKVDFDASIIAWHLATSICYDQDSKNANDALTEAMKISKYLSDYMVYLLVMRPAMLLPEDCRSSSLDLTFDQLMDLVSKAPDKVTALNSVQLDQQEFSAQTAMEDLPKYAGCLATKLKRKINERERRWELIKAMWIEILLYAAHSNLRINHVRQLGQYGREFITIIWVMGSYRVIQEVIEEACVKEE